MVGGGKDMGGPGVARTHGKAANNHNGYTELYKNLLIN